MKEDWAQFRKEVEAAYAKVWGPRCEMKDTDDFPELKDDPISRCACCFVYELLDKQLDQLDIETKKWFNRELKSTP